MENSKMKPKIIFIGTPKFGAIILQKLCEAGMSPILVITETDKPSGRGRIIASPPVKIVAENYGIPVLQPEKIRNLEQQIKDSSTDIIVVASYGQILPQEILGLPKYGCLNVHPSLLPKYRGPSPIQSAILNGDKETGATIILMDGEIDHGPILTQKNTAIGPNETAEQLHDRLAALGVEILIDVIPDWLAGRIEIRPQDEKNAAYTKILTKEDGLIDWKKSPAEIDRQIRALNPWPGAYTFWEREKKKMRLRVLKAKLENGKLVIEEVQPEGKKPMTFKDFLRGNPNFKYADSH